MMTVLSQGKHLAELLQALQQLEKEKSDFNAEWKERKERILNLRDRVKEDILSGQQSIFDQERTEERQDHESESAIAGTAQ